jgi:hypothetical protein
VEEALRASAHYVAPQVRQLGDVGGDAPRLVFVAVAGGSLLKRKK